MLTLVPNNRHSNSPVSPPDFENFLPTLATPFAAAAPLSPLAPFRGEGSGVRGYRVAFPNSSTLASIAFSINSITPLKFRITS